MGGGAQPHGDDRRHGDRCRVDHRLLAENRRLGDVLLHIVNVSPQGFMVSGDTRLERGERAILRLPAIGLIEAFMTWVSGERAGFQFERVLRRDDFVRMVEALQAPSPPPRDP